MHLNDFGTQIQFTVLDRTTGLAVDCSTMNYAVVTFQRPLSIIPGQSIGVSTFNRQCGFLTSGTDGILTYTTQSGEINTPGLWRFQLYLNFPSGSFYSDKQEFTVHENIVMPVPGT